MLEKPSVEPQNKIRVAGKPTMHILKSTGREGGAEKGILPCVGCVGSGEARLDRSCEGVLGFVDELTSLAVLPTHSLGSLIKPTGNMAWMEA